MSALDIEPLHSLLGDLLHVDDVTKELEVLLDLAVGGRTPDGGRPLVQCLGGAVT